MGLQSCPLAIAILLTTTTLHAQNQLRVPDTTLVAGSTDVAIPILLDSDQDLYALSLSLSTADDNLVLKEVRVENAVTAGAGWSFGRTIDGGARLTWGIVLDVTDPFDVSKVIPAGQDTLVAHVMVDVRPDFEGTTTLQFRDFQENLSAVPPDPGARNKLLIADGEALPLTTVDGSILVEVGVGPFLRGDCNQDGQNLGSPTDAIYLLSFLFAGGEGPICEAACDFNGDGAVEASPTDAVFYLSFNFLGGDPLPDPVRSCGRSSRAGDIALGCGDPAGCTASPQ